MSADQLIAELKALSLTERQQIISAFLSDAVVRLAETPVMVESVGFVEKWTGKFSHPESNPEDARLTFLLDRFSS